MPESSCLTAVRASYDTVAAAYAERVLRPSELDPFSRGMLAAFAETVRRSALGPVADLGCGPGYVTAHLAGLGLPVFGVDLSAGMVEPARRAHPDLRFVQSSMTALGVGDGVLGGILAWYSTHHTPPAELPLLFAGFQRTLAPGGHLLWGCHIGDEQRRLTRAYGHPVSYAWHLLPVERVAGLLERAGLRVVARLVQEPDEQSPRPCACLLACKA
ncbi:class I SAM-dependent methyltransferase [Streptomyces thermoalcalitolerans]|uniref:class I SAM-dependent DNA methyltransferase n=1 Tax=Streptomyces thermoalcalitolerans TaxID=65605 RepID=UPI0031D08FBD